MSVISETKFNRNRFFLLVANVLLITYIVFFFPSGYGIWGWRGANIYAYVLVLPNMFKIFKMDFWRKSRLEAEQKLNGFWFYTIFLWILIFVVAQFLPYFEALPEGGTPLMHITYGENYKPVSGD